jgi:phospholipid-binding lipoprotein MlaA
VNADSRHTTSFPGTRQQLAHRRIASGVLAAALLGTGCATTNGAANPADPLESFNRSVYEFNDTVDRYALKPLAQGYRKVVPEPLQLMVRSFFGNLSDFLTAGNNLLQAKPGAALVDVSRLVVNSTLGFGGVADVASEIGLTKHDEDFGQTLGWWGVPSGPYLVLPFLGPSTFRDAPARVVDAWGRLLNWSDLSARVSNSLLGLYIVSGRADLLDAERVVEGAALDRYSLIRDGWLQRRRQAVHDGNPPDEPYPEDDDSWYKDDLNAKESASDGPETKIPSVGAPADPPAGGN